MGGDIIGYGSFRPPSHSHTTYCDVKAVSKIAFYPPAAWLDPLQDWKNLHLIGIGVAGLLDGWTILTITLRTSCLAGTDYWLQATSSWFQDHFPPLFPPPPPSPINHGQNLVRGGNSWVAAWDKLLSFDSIKLWTGTFWIEEEEVSRANTDTSWKQLVNQYKH